MPRTLAVFLAAALLAPAVPAQEPGERLCGTCKTTGRVPLDVSSKFKVEFERGETWEVVHCAHAIEEDAVDQNTIHVRTPDC